MDKAYYPETVYCLRTTDFGGETELLFEEKADRLASTGDDPTRVAVYKLAGYKLITNTISMEDTE